jgi:ADP-ribosylglycohydrolase
MAIEQLQRYRGCLLGLAAGDALGSTLEFSVPGTFTPIDDMVGGGHFGLEAGQWTDDTSMALCMAESLIAHRKFHPLDIMRRFLKWYREGYLSSTGSCFDIGTTCRRAIERFELTGEPFCGSLDPMSAGNGSVMRLAPMAMFFARQPYKAILACGDSSMLTHGAVAAVDACRLFGALLVGALSGESKEKLLSERYSPVPDFWRSHRLVPEIDEIAKGSYKFKSPPEIKGTGYVVKSLEAALWAFYNSTNFRDGCLIAANLGDDADTTAAIYGQLAGAYYGVDDIPAMWLKQLAMHDYIDQLAQTLFACSQEVTA